MQAILSTLLTQALEHSPEVVLFIVTGVLVPFAIKWMRAHTSVQQQQLIADVAGIAYWAVKHIADATPTKVDDEIAAGIKIMQQQLAPKGVNITEDVARAVLQGVHGQQAAAGK